MIGIQIEDTFLDLQSGQKIQITSSNPATDKDSVARVFSYPFQVAATPRNLAALLNANRLDAKRRGEADYRPEVTMYVGGAPFEYGRLTIGQVSPDALECSFGNQERKLLDDLATIKIRSLMPTISVPQGETGTWIFTINPVLTPYEYRVLINDVSYFHLASPGDDEFDAGTALRDLINAAYPGTAIVSGGTPTLEIRAETNDPFAVSTYSGLTLVSAVTVGEAVHTNLVDYLTDLQSVPADSHSFPMIRHDGFYGDANIGFTGFINYFHDGTFGSNEPSVEKEWAYTYVPFVAYKYVLDQIADNLGFVWAGDFYDSVDFAQARMFSNYCLDKLRYEWFDFGYKYYNSWKTAYNLADHVPDITAKAFLDLVFSLFNIYPTIRDKTITLHKRRDQLSADLNNISLNVVQDYRMTLVPKRGLTLRFKGVAAIQAVNAGQLDDYVIGDGKNVLEFDLYPLPDSYFNDSATDTTMRLAWVFEKGSSDEMNVGINAFPLRIFFDRGLQSDSDGDQYHMGTHLDTDFDGVQIGDLSLEWDGDRGLYETLWKGWAEIQDGQPIEISAILPIGEARRLLNWERPAVRFFHPMGSTRGIIQTFRFSAGTDDSAFLKVDFDLIQF
jgi:hypothetical protein